MRGWLALWLALGLGGRLQQVSTTWTYSSDVTEKIKLGDNLMGKIQRALRAKITDAQPPETGGLAVAGGAPTAAGGPGAVGIPGINELAEKRDSTVTRLTNPYLDTTKSGDETSRTFADVTGNDIEVAAGHSRNIQQGFPGRGNSTVGGNRRAYDREDDRDKMEEFRRYVERRPEPLERGVRARAARRGGASPDPQRLDLAPARGGRVAAKRLEGRVCQRSVLLPEGPKYDSGGRVYLAGFQRGARAFQHTRSPPLLLPRCCNCCRKSVLGCE